jgi:SPASM domain peptide maturase of grasp-with-spasm system
LDLADTRSKHLILFADCVPVKGLRRSAIYDLTRHEVHLFPSEFHPLLEWLTTRTVGDVEDALAAGEDAIAEDKLEAVRDFMDFLLDNELALLTDDPTRFPTLPVTWDFPGDIQNAVIDVDASLHDFDGLISQLDRLGCQFLQIRGFSSLLTLEVCGTVLARARNTAIESVELIVKYDPSIPVERYMQFLRDEAIVTNLTVHSAPAGWSPFAESAANVADEVRGDLTLTEQVIDSKVHCGVISPRQLNAPSVAAYSEFRLFNGCLNRKIAVGADGQIRNCPSMSASFGSASEVPLEAVVRRPEFARVGRIRKDEIDVCRECEFRYMCSDCRAYVEDPTDEYSKPLKCGYDPATATWHPWHRPRFKWAVMQGYGIPLPAGPPPAEVRERPGGDPAAQ